MAKTFHVSVARVTETIFDGEAISLTCPGEEGVLTILADHESLVTPLAAGSLYVKTLDGSTTTIEVAKGILEVSGNQATVLL